MNGEAFYTVPADHYNCAVGSHTHSIPLPEARANELMDTVGFMVNSGYVKMEEVPGIPTLPSSPNVIAYAPVDQATFAPNVVIVAATPAQAMSIYEAALRAGATSAVMGSLGRPACAALPLAIGTGAAAISLGCKGNRTFTGLPDAEMYVCIPGDKWQGVLDHLGEILDANNTMGAHYTAHQQRFAG
jgi:uncharacterized protein (DUF169 family)